MGTGTELGRVRGLGSAKHGATHWWRQRVTSATNFLLMWWFVISIARLPSYDYVGVHAWLASMWVAIPLAVLVLSVCWHFRLGLQTVIEDYQHDETHIVLMILLNLFTVGIAATALFSILKIAFTATAVATTGAAS